MSGDVEVEVVVFHSDAQLVVIKVNPNLEFVDSDSRIDGFLIEQLVSWRNLEVDGAAPGMLGLVLADSDRRAHFEPGQRVSILSSCA